MYFTVRCRTNRNVILIVNLDSQGDAVLTSRRYTSAGEARDYVYPPLPPKRWWGEHISAVHPRDRGELHKFLGLS